MKKIISFLISFTLILSGISAEKWKNKIGLGFTLPLSSLEFDDKNTDSIFTKNFGTNGFFLGVKDNGFSLKADFSLGVATSDDVKIDGNSVCKGFFYDVAFGAGYTFVKSENLTVSLLGMLGFDVTIFNCSNDDVLENSKRYKKIETQYSMGTLDLGLDLFLSYKVLTHFGFYTNLGLRYLPKGRSSYEKKWTFDEDGYEKTSSGKIDAADVKGKFRIQPAIGIMWNF